MNRTRTVLLPLLKGFKAHTDGVSSGSPTPTYFDLDIPEFRLLLPYAESLTLYSLTESGPAANEFEWNIVFRSGYNRFHETSDINKIAAANITTNGSVRHAVFNDTTKFQLESRLQLAVNNGASVSGVRAATLSATLAIVTVGM